MSALRTARSYQPLLLGLLCLGCAGVEKGRYGVDTVELVGVERVSAASLRTCLLTRERESFGLRLGLRAPQCDRPPFDQPSVGIALWRWPWADWPTLNKAVIDKDIERIVRWYRARGFYDAKVVDVRVEPPEAGQPGWAAESEETEQSEETERCDPEVDECTADVTIVVEEGEPVLVERVVFKSARPLPPGLLSTLRAAASLARGVRFDEHAYDEDKERIVSALRKASFAGAEVSGRARIDTASRRAVVEYQVRPGPSCTFGELAVSGHGDLSVAPIVAAADLEPGTRYSPSVVAEIQREVQAIGDFAAVSVEEQLDRERAVVDLDVHITLADPHSLRLGFGVQSGSIQRAGEVSVQSVPQWDLHLLARYSYKNFLDTLGELQIEERPRIIYNAAFPAAENRSFGNILRTAINQPGLLEARTDATFSVTWDYGPDPYLGFERSDIIVRLEAERWFLSRTLQITLSLEQDVYIVPQTDNMVLQVDDDEELELPTSYDISFVGENIVVDLRDAPLRPSEGAYFGAYLAQAPRWALSDWTLLTVRPEARGYLSLPLDIVVAARLALAWTFILDASSELEETSQRLGPSVYRLRGGGANSVRGFAPGRLGDGLEGGLRRWEAMFETRLPVGESFEIASILDFGDVSADEFRFSHINTSLGFGLRYHSPIGALRLDTSFRLMGLQRTDGSRPEVEEADRMFLLGVPGAMHFTIGEAF